MSHIEETDMTGCEGLREVDMENKSGLVIFKATFLVKDVVEQTSLS